MKGVALLPDLLGYRIEIITRKVNKIQNYELLYIVLADLVMKSSPGNTKEFCCLFSIIFGVGKCLSYELLFDFIQRLTYFNNQFGFILVIADANVLVDVLPLSVQSHKLKQLVEDVFHSRTLPGHSYSSRAAMASGFIRMIFYVHLKVKISDQLLGNQWHITNTVSEGREYNSEHIQPEK